MSSKIITLDEFSDKEIEEAGKEGKGFKETEIGLIPEGWEVRKLGEIAKVTSGGTPSRSKTEYWKNGTVPWLKISDLKPFYVRESEEKITEEGLKNSSAKIFPKGTILFTVFATLGDVAIMDIDAATNQAISGIFINDESKVNKLYLAYYLKSLKDSWVKKSKGVTQRNINQTILKNTLVPIPPLPTQQKVVARLDAFFEHYNELKKEKQKAKEKYEQIIQSAIASLIPQKELPEGWKKDLLVNLCSKKPQYGYTATCVKEKVGPIYLRITDIDFKGNVDWNNVKFVDLPKEEHDKFKLEKGDIVIARTGATAGKAYLFNGEDKDMIFASYLIRFRCNQGLLLPEYLFIYMQSSLYWYHISKELLGTGQPNVNAKKLGNLEVVYPDIETQKAILNMIGTLKSNIGIITEEQKNIDCQLEQLPKAVLSKAFKGELVS